MTKPKVIFFEEDHSYYLLENSKKTKLESVSSFYSKYKNSYNSGFWSAYKAYEKILPPGVFKDLKKTYGYDSPELLIVADMYVKDKEYFKTVQQQILNNWKKENKKSTDKGTEYHNTKETNAFINGAAINKYNLKCYNIGAEKLLDYNNYSIADNLYNLCEGFYPELLVFNEEALLAGQADKVFITEFGGEKYVDIGDFKTNKKISKESFIGSSRKHTYLKPPLNHIMDSNYWHYALQLSTYAFMLEKFGFRVRSLYLEHYDEIYFLPYLFNEIQNIYEIKLAINKLKRSS